MSGICFRLTLTLACVSIVLSKYNYEIKYLNVPLDHFSFVDNRNFPLRYLINDSYWTQNSPIFFYTGNEGDIEMFAQNTGYLWEAAAKFQALVLFAEHRYYGRSMPFGNDSLKKAEYFGYLNSQQALADFVDVIYHVKNNQDVMSEDRRLNPVIAFGGSYGGMLAAWMRMKYPAVIIGSLASSAPIWQFTGMTSCLAYNEVLTAAYNASSTECVRSIRNSWQSIKNLVRTESGRNWITRHWKLCKPLETVRDIKEFKDWLTEMYSNIAMINYPYASNFLMPVPAKPVQVFCSYLNDSSSSDELLLNSLLQAANVYFNFTGNARCLDWSSSASSSLGVDGYNIQACTEMVMPMCSNGVTDMFEPQTWNFMAYSENCYQQYQIRPKEFMAEKEYGGKHIESASNIIFSNGVLDPWFSGGVTHYISRSTVIVIISESAHHLDLRASNPDDPTSVVKARKLYSNIFKRWIREYKKHTAFS